MGAVSITEDESSTTIQLHQGSSKTSLEPEGQEGSTIIGENTDSLISRVEHASCSTTFGGTEEHTATNQETEEVQRTFSTAAITDHADSTAATTSTTTTTNQTTESQYRSELLALLQNDFQFLQTVCERELAMSQEHMHTTNYTARRTWLANDKVALDVELCTLQKQVFALELLLKKTSVVAKDLDRKTDITVEDARSLVKLKECLQSELREETDRNIISGLPAEVLDKIFSHVTKKRDLCNLSLTGKLFKSIVRERLWNRPKFRRKMSAEDLAQLGDVPIRVLETSSLDTDFSGTKTAEYVRVMKQMPHLSKLVVDNNIPLPDLQLFSQLDLPMSVRMSCLDMNASNIRQYVDVFRGMGEHLEELCDCSFGLYKYNSCVLRLFQDLPLKQLDTIDLALGSEPVSNFVDVMKRMTHLRVLTIGHSPDEYLLTPDDLLLMSDLPSHVTVRLIDVCCLDLDRNNLGAVVDALSKIKQLDLMLDNFWLRDSYHTENVFRFGLDEFKKFAQLPIRSLTTTMLDINDDNVQEFLAILGDLKLSRDVRIVEPESMVWLVSWDRIMDGLRKMPKPWIA